MYKVIAPVQLAFLPYLFLLFFSQQLKKMVQRLAPYSDKKDPLRLHAHKAERRLHILCAAEDPVSKRKKLGLLIFTCTGCFLSARPSYLFLG